MGGSDIRSMSKPLLLDIKENFPHVKINLVIGPSFKNSEELQSLELGNVNIVKSPNAEEMYSLMQESDVAISAGGQTLYELYASNVSIVATTI